MTWRPLFAAVAVLATPLLTVCVAAQATAPTRPAAAARSAVEDPLREGDIISISVATRQGPEPDLTQARLVVPPDGRVTLRLLESQEINLLGMTDSQLKSKLTELYDRYLVNPIISVVILERAPQYVYLTGAVGQNGRFTLERNRDTTLNDLIQNARYQGDADLTQIRLTRGGTERVVNLLEFLEEGRAHNNLVLEAEDRIFVPKRQIEVGIVQVYGAGVNRQGTQNIQRGQKLSEVLSLAGGLTSSADARNVEIRRAGGETLKVDALKAISDPSTDIGVEPGDIINVPTLAVEQNYTITGAIPARGTVPLRDKETLTRAVAKAGGIPNGMITQQVRIMRTTGDRNQEIAFTGRQFDEIKAGQMEDPEIQPGDIIQVEARSANPTVIQQLGRLLPFGWLFGLGRR